MEFVKRNLIFLVIGVVGVAGVFFCLALCIIENGRLCDQMAQTEQVQKYLMDVSKKQVKLVQENVDMAKKNAEENQKVADAFIKELRDTYRLEYESTDIPLDALRNIQTMIQLLRNRLQDNDIDLSQSAANLGFDALINSTTPPKKEELPKMFRRLAVIRMLVDKLLEAKDKEESTPIRLEKLEFHLGMEVQKEQYYTVTPLTIEITSTAMEGQKFINSLIRMKNLLGFVRCIEVKSPNQPSAVFTSVANASGDNSRGERRPEDRRGDPGERRGGPEDRRGKPGERRGGPGERRGGPGERRKGTPADESHFVEIEKMRHDYLAFEKGRTTWNLRVDLLESLQEEKKGTGEGAKASGMPANETM